MEIVVLNKELESIAIIDAFESLIWTDRYCESGDCELYLPATAFNVTVLQEDYYLYQSGSERLMYVEDIEIETDAENGNHMTVTGRSLEALLERRIIWGQRVLRGDIQTVIGTLLNENVISPSDTNRKIPYFSFQRNDDPSIPTTTLEIQFTGDNLYEAIQIICETYSVGFKVTADLDNKKFVLSLYVGKDRSYNQTTNPYVVFSPDFENLIASNYYASKRNLKNAALVAGEGEGAERKTVTIAGEASGLDRRELFVDARDISSSTSEGDLSLSEYNALLTERGNEKLVEYEAAATFEGEVDDGRSFKYGRDYYIGDIVQIINEYGMEGTARVCETVYSQNEEGTAIYPTFTTI